MNGIPGGGSCTGQMQMQGMQQQQGAGGRFNKLDADGSGDINQDELQVMADKLSLSGQDINVQETAVAYDANGDGLLDKNETQGMMKEIKGTMKGGQGTPSTQQTLAAYLSEPVEDSVSTLLEMLGEQTESPAGYTPFYAET